MGKSIWKTITLGINKSPAEYRNKALEVNGYRIGEYADKILNKVKISDMKIKIDLVLESVAGLGFKEGGYLHEIYARAIRLGRGELCPAEVGPALRQQYPDQPYGESLRIAMEPLTDSVGNPFLFVVEYVLDDRWLYTYHGALTHFFYASHRFVFASPRK